MRNIIIIAVILLFFLHQDFWWWGDGSLVWGFMPVGLAYHAAYSVAAGLVWALAVKFAWPQTVEDEAGEAAERDEGAATPS